MFKNFSLTALMFSLSLFSAYGEEGDVEKIKVTGSHIKRMDQQGTTPVTVIDRNQLDFSGASSLADVIRDLSFASFGVHRKTSLADGNGQSYTSFRGLPVGYILILINGKRYGLQDINLIPMSAVERVEIIKDGASATYGSDAVGGVMNFITKTGDIGASFSAGFSLPEPFVLPKDGWRSKRWRDVPKYKDNMFGLKGGEELNVESSYGWSEGNAQNLVAVSLKRQENFMMYDRPFSMVTMADNESFSTMGSPGSYTIGGKQIAMEGCSESPSSYLDREEKDGVPTGNETCKYNFFELMEYAPTVTTASLFATSKIDLDNSELYVHGLYSYENSLGVLAPPPDNLTKKNFTTKSVKGVVHTNPEKVKIWDAWAAAIGYPGLTGIFYRMVDEKGAGQRMQRSHKHLFDLQAELETYLLDTWSLNTSVGVNGYLQLDRHKNYAKRSELLSLDANGAAKWNPFKTQKDDISFASYEPKGYTHLLLGMAEASVDGELLSFDLGSLNTAVGARAAYEHWTASWDKDTWDSEKQASNQWGGGSGQVGSGGRYSGTAFGELVLPLHFDSSNALELQAAGSADYYQYAGPTLNPKLSLKWMLADQVNLRGSWGTGFRAPDINLVHIERIQDHPYGVDYTQCSSNTFKDCSENENLSSDQYDFIYTGSKNLKPETSTFYNIGVTYEPSNNIFLALDYFSNHIKDRIQDPQISDITQMEKFHPNEFKTFAQNNNIVTDRVEGTGKINSLTSSYYNLGEYKTTGVEGEIMFQIPVLSHTAFLQTQATYFLDTQVKRTILDKEFKDKLGHWGFPYYKVSPQLGLRYKNGVHWALSAHWLSAFNAESKSESAPDNLFTKGKKWFKEKVLEEEVTKGVTATYSAEEAKEAADAAKKADKSISKVLQVPTHATFDLTVSVPLSAFNSNYSSKSSLLFKIENLLNSSPPEHRTGGNQQQNIADMRNIGFIPVGVYNGIHGRTWKVQYTHKL